MEINKANVIIRPEKPTEYEEVNRLIVGLGYGAVFLGGNPKLYARFGFKPSSLYGIYHENRKKWGDEGFMVCLLKAGVLDGITGTTSYYGG